MKRINALIRYELINIKRGALIWITLILYVFGLQQIISCIHFDSSVLSLVEFIKYSWLPLNFIMIPIMLLCMQVGGSENEVFNSMDISHKEIVCSKVGFMFLINGTIFLVNVIILIIFGINSRVSLHYFLYQSLGYIVNNFVFLIVSGLLGLFIGQVVSKHVGDVVAFIIMIMLFVALCNFYKLFNTIVPLYDIKAMTSTFNIFSYDKSYLYHNLFWLVMAFILFTITFTNNNKKAKPAIIIKLVLPCLACIYLATSIVLMTPVYYNICLRNEAANGQTFFSKANCGYYIDKYDMNINLNNKLKNTCNMEVKINGDSVNSMELGLYEKLNISSLEIDGKSLNFKRTNHSFIVKLPREYKNGETVNMNVVYEGDINTMWLQGRNLFFVKNNELFLADVFEWYPKLNDSKLKDYNVKIKYTSKNKIYSDLDGNRKLNGYKLQGKDREIFLVSGNISERKYNGYLFVGNEELIKDNQQCNYLIEDIKKSNSKEVNKVIFAPFIPGGTKMDIGYEKAYLFAHE